jgi:hypothetical protein
MKQTNKQTNKQKYSGTGPQIVARVSYAVTIFKNVSPISKYRFLLSECSVSNNIIYITI